MEKKTRKNPPQKDVIAEERKASPKKSKSREK